MRSSAVLSATAAAASTRTARSAVKHRTRSATKSSTSTEQQTLQAISVIQNTIQCGIAHICHSRNLFPSSFFRHLDVDVDVGLDADDQCTSNHGGACGSNAVVVFDLENQNEICRNASASASASAASDGGNEEASSCGHDSGGTRNNAKITRSGTCSAEEPEPSISPLTSDFDESKLNRHGHGHGPGPGHDHDHDHGRENNNAIMKAEVRLLLRWIQGLYDILVDGSQRALLTRVIFGICRPGFRREQNKNGNGNGNGNGNVNCNGNGEEEDSSDGHDDELVESFAFDLSSTITKGGTRTGTGSIDYGSIQNQYQTLFRNLQSFTTLSLPPDRNNDVHAPLYINNDIASPRSRYFTFRVEFCQKCVIPQALDPMDGVNRHADASKHSSMICERMKTMVETPLGQVVEKNCTGLGVRLVAYNVDEDEDFGDGADSYFECRNHDREPTPRTHESLHSGDDINVDPSPRKRRKKSPTRTHTRTVAVDRRSSTSVSASTFESKREAERIGVESISHSESPSQEPSQFLSTQPQIETVLKHKTNAYAIPCTRKNDDLTQAKARRYIPCQILGHRIKNGSVHYKLLFYDDALDQAKMKKQWLNSKKVMAADAMEKRVRDELEVMIKRGCGVASDGRLIWENAVNELVESIALERASVEYMLNCMEDLDLWDHEEDSDSPSNACSLDELFSDQMACHEEGKEIDQFSASRKISRYQYSYTYAMNPITVMVVGS